MRTLFLALALTLAFAAAASGATWTGRSDASAKNGKIAFSAKVHGNMQVFTVKPDGTQLRQITHGTSPAGDNGLAWSPNGRALLYSLGNNGKGEIVRSGADGSNPTVISPPCTGTCLGDADPAYSPDGTKIAFERAVGPLVNGNASRVAIFTMNANGSNLTQLTQKNTPTSSEDHLPQWSPDGTKIAFTRLNTTAAPTNSCAVEVMNADGSKVQELTPFRIDGGGPYWSPNGRRILYSTYFCVPVQGKSANIFTMLADGTHPVALTHYAGGTMQAFAQGWSPGGTQILFHRAAFSGTDTQVGGFFILTMRNKHIRRLTAVRIRYDTDAAWGR
jgi:Tol biopolymer transport system component